MRLEGGDDAALGPGFARRLQGGGKLGGMMTIIIDQQHRALGREDLAVELETSADAGETRQRPFDGRRLDAQLVRNRDSSQRVQHVVPAGQVQGDRPALALGQQGGEVGALTVALHVGRSHRRILGKAVGEHGTATSGRISRITGSSRHSTASP